MSNNSVNCRSFFIENGISYDDDTVFDRELEYKFDCWFSNLLTDTVKLKDNSFITIPRTIEEVSKDISNEELEVMGYSCGWYDEFLDELIAGTIDIRNAVYSYAIHLLYLYNDSVCYEDKCWLDGMEFNYDAVYTFLNNIMPY